MADSIRVSSGKGFKFITNFVIHETSRQKVVLDFKYIPDEKQELHHVTLDIVKLSKKPSEKWENAKKEKIILSTEKPSQSLVKLIDAMKAQGDLYRRSNSEVVILDKEEANLFRQVRVENVEFIARILESFKSPEAREFLSKIQESDLRNLFVSVKFVQNKQAVLELEKLISEKATESNFQKWIEGNTWVFGTEYINRIDQRKIGIHSEADFIFESLDGFTDLIEIKKPSLPLFKYDASRKCYYPAEPLAQVLGQAAHYIKVMEQNAYVLMDNDGINVLKPRVKVIIGRSQNMNQEEKKSLRILNSTLHGIEIITYDDVVLRGKKLLSFFNQDIS